MQINQSLKERDWKSKQILKGINDNLLAKLNVNQSRDTRQIIDWFKKLECKSKSEFVKVDIKNIIPQ